MRWTFCLAGLVFIWFATVRLCSAPLDEWHWRNPRPQGNTLNDLIFTGDRFMAVGESGALVTSGDGITWTDRSFTNLTFSAIAQGGGKIVAVGPKRQVMVSTNGTDWSTTTPNLYGYFGEPLTFTDFYGVCHGSGRFVAVAAPSGAAISGGIIASSTDGIEWQTHTSSSINTNPILRTVIFANGRYVAIGDSIATSTNATNWNFVSTPVTLRSVAYGNGVFVTAGGGSGHRFFPEQNGILTSTNGTNWQVFRGATNRLDVVLFDGERFIALGDRILYWSTNGASWISQAMPESNVLKAAASANGRTVCVGTFSEIMTSDDGFTWTERVANNSHIFRGLACGDGRTVVVGDSVAAISHDQIEWSIHSLDTNKMLRAVCYGPVGFVAVGAQGIVCTSADGETWMEQSSVTTNDLNAIAFANGRFVAVGKSGTIVRSVDGTNWTAYSVRAEHLNGVVFGNGAFVAVGNTNLVVKSVDGEIWEEQTASTLPSLKAITHGRGLFVGGDSSGYLWTSTDGANWSPHSSVSGHRATIEGVTFVDGVFVALSYNGWRFTSIDGATWMYRGYCNSQAIAAGTVNGTVILMGAGGAIIQSKPVWQLASENRNQNAFVLNVCGESGAKGRLQVSTNLSTWDDAQNFTHTGSRMMISHTNEASTGFYRIVGE